MTLFRQVRVSPALVRLGYEVMFATHDAKLVRPLIDQFKRDNPGSVVWRNGSISGSNSMRFAFKSPSDAMLFKLTFGGKAKNPGA